jgi:hypothetical protein
MLTKTLLRAELSGSTICSAAGQVAISHTPILLLCRQLIEVGFDPSNPLEVYRGGTLALRVCSIGAAARLTVDESRTAFARWKPFSSAAVPSRIAPKTAAATSAPMTDGTS